MKTLGILAALVIALPVHSSTLGGSVALTNNQGPVLATSGTVYIIPDTPENWQAINRLSDRVSFWINLSRQVALTVKTQDQRARSRDYNATQTRLKGLLARLVTVAKEKAKVALPITMGQFDATDIPDQVILVIQAQAPEGLSLENKPSTLTLMGWWLVRTPSQTGLEIGPKELLYQVGLPL